MVPERGQPGPLELLVVQPTPFCNINCSYCYLPERQSTKIITALVIVHRGAEGHAVEDEAGS